MEERFRAAAKAKTGSEPIAAEDGQVDKDIENLITENDDTSPIE